MRCFDQGIPNTATHGKVLQDDGMCGVCKVPDELGVRLSMSVRRWESICLLEVSENNIVPATEHEAGDRLKTRLLSCLTASKDSP